MIKKLAIFFISLSLLGCATLQAPTEKEIKNDFDSQIGKLSYDDAISRLGSPANMTPGVDIFVAEWYEQNERVFLTFDKDTGLLRSWSYNGPAKTVGNLLKETAYRASVAADAMSQTHFGN